MSLVFELSNPDGSLQLDLSSLTARLLGQATIGLSAGSITHPGFSTGRGWFYLVPLSDDTRSPRPSVSVSGSGASYTISWTARNSGRNCIIMYGVY